MTLSTLAPIAARSAARPVAAESVLVACPDARPPAYQAAVGPGAGRDARAGS